MNSIVLFYWPNLTELQKETLLSLSDVGIVIPIESGDTTVFTRLRNVSLADIQTMGLAYWEFPAKELEESDSAYTTRLEAELRVAFNLLNNGVHDCAYVSEEGFQQVVREPYFITL